MANIYLLHWLTSWFIGYSQLRFYFLTFCNADLENDCFLGSWDSLTFLPADEDHTYLFSWGSPAQSWGPCLWLQTWAMYKWRISRLVMGIQREFIRLLVSPREAMHWRPQILFTILLVGAWFMQQQPCPNLFNWLPTSPFRFRWGSASH